MGWSDARDYFYKALTATNNNDRETYFAKTFQAIGQVLHMLEDMSVPARSATPQDSWTISSGEVYSVISCY